MKTYLFKKNILTQLLIMELSRNVSNHQIIILLFSKHLTI